MGLMTFLTGKERIVRKLEAMDKKLDGQFTPILLRTKDQLKIKNGEEFNLWLGSWKIGFTINQFITHWLRTKLDLHPKWTTEGTFNDESPVLIAYLMIQLAALKRTPTEEKLGFIIAQRALVVTGSQAGAPSIDSLVRDMFKTCPLTMLLEDSRFSDEALRGLKILENGCESYALQSGLDHDLQTLKGLIACLTVAHLTSQ